MPESFKAPFLQTLLERGFIHQCTDFKTLDENRLIKELHKAFVATSTSEVADLLVLPRDMAGTAVDLLQGVALLEQEDFLVLV